ncbi:MAG: TetR/AcrR family transcriptional regulator [Actinomycetota bacterium]
MNAEAPSGLPRPPGRPRNREAERAILEATCSLIGERGIGGVSMVKVAIRSGASKSTIYRRWPSRGDLIREVFAAFARHKVPIPDTGTIRGDLVSLLASIIRVYATTPGGPILPEILAESHRSSELAEAMKEFWISRRQTVFDVLAGGVSRGELLPDIDYELAVELLVGPIYYRFLISRLPLAPEQAEVIVDAVLKRMPRIRGSGIGHLPPFGADSP